MKLERSEQEPKTNTQPAYATHVALLTVVRDGNVGKRPRRCGDVLQRCCASVTEIPHISSRCSAPSTQHRSPLTTSGQINLINCFCDPALSQLTAPHHRMQQQQQLAVGPSLTPPR